MITNPENPSNEIETNIQSGITRRTFIKRTGATAIASTLALHMFRSEARAEEDGSSCRLPPLHSYGCVISVPAMDRDYDFLPVGDNAANNAEEQGLAILAAITAQADNPAVFNTNPGEDKVTTEMWETRHKTKTLESLIIIISGTGVTINTAPDGSLVSVHAPAGTAFTITMQWATVEED